MSTEKKEKKTKSKDRVEKKHKKDKKEKKSSKSKKKEHRVAEAAFSLLASDNAVNPALSSLFAVQAPLIKAAPQPIAEPEDVTSGAEVDDDEEENGDEANDAELSSIASEGEDEDAIENAKPDSAPQPQADAKSRRTRKHDEEEVEDVYMRRLEREDAKEAEAARVERASKRQKAGDEVPEDSEEEADDAEPTAASDDDEIVVEEEGMSPPPKHETEMAADIELSKANRTVFLGNVSTTAISSKTGRKQLIDHLKSFFDNVSAPKGDDTKFSLESIRFRSTPYDSKVPKKAAFATKQLMDATTKSTNAYAVYSHPQLAREAAIFLNGTTVLSRHLRVDSVAHPARVDNKRCIFVGNLGFVDDESNIQQANAEDGREQRKPGKEPADVEEGLWRTFGKCGTVESVRVIRDSTTRVGKGIAYVQFDDGNAVEAALLYNEKKFPPMLPRKLRVSRAKVPKRNPKANSGRPSVKSSKGQKGSGYQRKITGEEASQMGRAGKLFGRAAAAQTGKGEGPLAGMRRPEDFVFEGHRAQKGSGKAGLKLGGKAKGKGKPAGRSAKRGAAFKAKGKGK